MSEVRGGSREELPRVRGQGWWPGVPGCDSTHSVGSCHGAHSMAKRSYPMSEVRDRIWEYSMPKARGGSREEQPHVQGAVAAWAQEGLEELSHVEGQEGQW